MSEKAIRRCIVGSSPKQLMYNSTSWTTSLRLFHQNSSVTPVICSLDTIQISMVSSCGLITRTTLPAWFKVFVPALPDTQFQITKIEMVELIDLIFYDHKLYLRKKYFSCQLSVCEFSYQGRSAQFHGWFCSSDFNYLRRSLISLSSPPIVFFLMFPLMFNVLWNYLSLSYIYHKQ